MFCARSHKIILKPQLITTLPFPLREKANLLEFLARPISWCYLQSHEMYTPLSQAYLGTSGLKTNTQDVRLKNKSICLKCQTKLTFMAWGFCFSAEVDFCLRPAPHTFKSPTPTKTGSQWGVVTGDTENKCHLSFRFAQFGLLRWRCGCFCFWGLSWPGPWPGDHTAALQAPSTQKATDWTNWELLLWTPCRELWIWCHSYISNLVCNFS